MLRAIFTILLMTFFLFGKAQVLTFNNPIVHNGYGQPGDFISPELTITNTSASTVQVFVNRIQKILPPNWLSCYCFIQCYSPTVDTLRFNMQAGETVTMNIGFTTDANVGGYGTVKITVETVGGPQKDTLDFSATTMATGINSASRFKNELLYPSPAREVINFKGGKDQVVLLQIINQSGKVMAEVKPSEETTVFDISMYPSGNYFMRVSYATGKTKDHQFIKN